jgi:NADP-dependent 3-hydroxy acid dehydrogenase YdfG
MKKAIIVGASSGIGITELKNENPDRYFIKTFDITDTNNVSQQLEELINELGGLDLLIITSGTGNLNDNMDFEIEKQTIDTNVSGFTAIADWAFNYFEKQTFGHLVAISSIAGLRGSRQAPAYNATKAFQINYLEGLRQKSNKLKTEIAVTDIEKDNFGLHRLTKPQDKL